MSAEVVRLPDALEDMEFEAMASAIKLSKAAAREVEASETSVGIRIGEAKVTVEEADISLAHRYARRARLGEGKYAFVVVEVSPRMWVSAFVDEDGDVL